MKTNLKKVDGIYDVTMPITPETGLLDNASIILVILILVLFGAYLTWLKFYSRKAIAKRKLHKLKQNIKVNRSNKKIEYDIAKYLKQGLDLTKINLETSCPANKQSQKKRWGRFLHDLSSARYQPGTVSNKHLLSLIHEAEYWLK